MTSVNGKGGRMAERFAVLLMMLTGKAPAGLQVFKNNSFIIIVTVNLLTKFAYSRQVPKTFKRVAVGRHKSH